MAPPINLHTRTVEYTEDGQYHRLEIRYGFECFSGQDPYFSITGAVFGPNGYNVWGCVHDEIRKYAPDLAPLIKWHLVSVVKGPMHYVANGLFWWERSLMKELVPLYKGDSCPIGDEAFENFKKTVVYGATKHDSLFMYGLKSYSKHTIEAWLKFRFNLLMEMFFNDMRKFELMGLKEVYENG